jgi:hypothetical protein
MSTEVRANAGPDAVYRNPRSAPAAALYRLPKDTRLDEAGRWATTAHRRADGERVLRWLERAKVEGAILREGSL